MKPRFTDLFVQRPVLALVLSALMLLVGIQAGTHLKLREYPEIERSVIFINTAYPGASAETVQGFVTTPLQRRIASAKGVEYVTSQSDPSFSQIEAHVRLGEKSTEVLTEVITKVNEARFELPREIEDPVVSNRSGGDAMMYMALLSDQMSVQQRADYAMRFIQPVLSTVEGVGEARVLGSGNFAMRIWLNPTKMAAFGVTAMDVDDAIRKENYISAAGTTRGEYVRASVDAETDLEDPDRFAAIVVRQAGDRRVTLGDVAKVELASETYESAVYSSGKATVFIAITEAPGANPLEVATRVKAKVKEINTQLPADMTIFMDADGSIYIREALNEVMRTLLEASAIVVLVIFLFLGSMRVVVIPIVAIPLSLITVLFLIWVMGFSINLLTLLAMVIAIGLVVDDAIVVVENVHRHIEKGQQPRDAALLGAREVATPVIAMTLTLVAVYLPIGFLGGLTGVLFSEFALTLAGAVVVSGVIALVLSPMMCAYLLQDHDHQGAVASWLDARFRALHEGYERWLARCLEHRGAVMLFGGVVLLSLPVFYQLAQRELAPKEDSGNIFAAATPPDYSSLEYTTYFLDQMVAAWKTVPEITHSWQVNRPTEVFGGLELKPWSERTRNLEEVRQEVQSKFDKISGLEIFTFAEGGLPGASGGLPVQFVISGNVGYEQLGNVADDVLAKARQSGMFAFVSKDLRFSRPEVDVGIDRELASRLGISMEDIGRTLKIMLGEAETNRFSIEGRSYKVIPQADRGFRLNKEWLERYYVRTTNGTLVPLSTVITLKQSVKPNTLRQFQQLNCVTIEGFVLPPNSLGDGLSYLTKTLHEVAPAGYRIDYQGESRRFVQESQNFLLLFASSLVFIYLVLSAQFNSFRDPLIVLVSVPLSIFGALVPLALGATTLNIYTQVGLLTLIGLISKHGILIVDFANNRLAEGVDRRTAVIEGAGLRLRPILMTTFATAVGVLPLLTAVGAGANARFAIGLMIAAGMLVGTLFTLFVLPTFYLVMGGRRVSVATTEHVSTPLAAPH
jgi:multidrug efflux pump